MIRNLGAVIIDELRLKFIQKTFEQMSPKEYLLDLGCGVKPFAKIYNKTADKSVGIEVKTTLHDQSHVDFFFDGESLPFENEEFDVVFSTEVMEHVPNPEKFLSEINRVLKPNGIAVLTVPFFVPLHEQPHDYYRYTEFGLRHLIQKSKFELIKFDVFGDYIGVMISLLITPHLKFWNIVSKKIHISILRKIYNPFIFLFIYLPQIIYLKIKNINAIQKILKKMEYMPKGYGVVIKKD